MPNHLLKEARRDYEAGVQHLRENGVAPWPASRPRPLYGYGVVDQDNKPYWSENCVCQDLGPMADLAAEMNEDAADGEVYRAVRLVIEEIDHAI